MILNILPYSAGHCHCHGNSSLVESCLHGLLRSRWWLEGIVWSRVRLVLKKNISLTAAVLRLSCGTFFVVHKGQTAIVFRKNMICLTRTGVVDCVWGLSLGRAWHLARPVILYILFFFRDWDIFMGGQDATPSQCLPAYKKSPFKKKLCYAEV